MANKRFEDLLVWQKARQLCNKIYAMTLLSEFSRDFSLKNQVLASSGSIMDNIAEDFERGGNKEFIQFLGIAKASCGESRSQLYRALDRKYISVESFEDTKKDCLELSVMIYHLSETQKAPEFKGSKFH